MFIGQMGNCLSGAQQAGHIDLTLGWS